MNNANKQLAIYSQHDAKRISKAVRKVEALPLRGPTQRGRDDAGGGGFPARLAKLKADLPSGGQAQGVFLIWDKQAGALVEHTADPAKYITIRDRLDDGVNDGISGTNGRRCWIVPDPSGSGWAIIQTPFTCS